MVLDGLGLGHCFEPLGSVLVFGDEPLHFGAGVWPRFQAGFLITTTAVPRVGVVDPRRWFLEGFRDLTGERAGGFQAPQHLGVFREGRVVEQQHDAQVREFLQDRGPHGAADYFRFFCVGRDQHGDAVGVVEEVPVQFPTGYAAVGAKACQGALAGGEVHQRRERQEGHHHQVGEGFGAEAEAGAGVVHQLFEHGRDHVAEPGKDGGEDADPAEDYLPPRWCRMDDRERFRSFFCAPLTLSDFCGLPVRRSLLIGPKQHDLIRHESPFAVRVPPVGTRHNAGVM